jgi:mono/diheme cytochrome c family protein
MNTVRHLVVATVATVLVIALLAVVYLNEPSRLEIETQAQQGEAIARGARLYDDYCAGCHGKRGEGLAGIYPPLNVSNLWEGREDLAFYGSLHDYIALNISAGHPSQNMPSWADEYGGPLRNDQVEDLTQFVMNWTGPQPEGVRQDVTAQPTKAVEEPTPAGPTGPVAEGDPAKGAELFAASCANCHGAGAEGGALGPTLIGAEVAAQDDQFFRDAITNGRPGTAMPPWGGVLSAQDIADVIAFLRSKQ